MTFASERGLSLQSFEGEREEQLMSTTADTDVRELDHRNNDGIDVRLLWSPSSGRVWIDVRDDRGGSSFELDVDPADALVAFHHPYTYAIGVDADRALAA
jgi:hypothetical protein